MSSKLFCCPECDELCKIPTPLRVGRYKCPECGHTLFRYCPNMIEKLYALYITALILFIITNLFPFLTFEVLGNKAQANFTTSIIYLYRDGNYLMAISILMTIFIIPLGRILLFLYLLAPMYHNRVPLFAPQALKIIEYIAPWGMLDVFLVGVLVSIVKLIKMGTIIIGTSLWALSALIVVLAYSASIFDAHPLWEKIERAQKEGKIESFGGSRV